MTDPEPLEGLVDTARRTRDSLARASDPPPEPVPEGETAAQAFTRRMNEQAAAERRDADLERAVAHENPRAPAAADLDDPLRAIANEQRGRRRRRRRRIG